MIGSNDSVKRNEDCYATWCQKFYDIRQRFGCMVDSNGKLCIFHLNRKSPYSINEKLLIFHKSDQNISTARMLRMPVQSGKYSSPVSNL